jgi:hypothetical protein
MSIVMVGLDLAKHVFQVHGVDEAGGMNGSGWQCRCARPDYGG